MEKILVLIALIPILAMAQGAYGSYKAVTKGTNFHTSGSSYCTYVKRTSSFYGNCGPYVNYDGTFDAKTGKILSQEVSLNYGQVRYIFEQACTVEPEWGEDYIDQECYKKKEQDWLQQAKSSVCITSMPAKSIYRQCEQHPAEDD